MISTPSLDTVWAGAPPRDGLFDPETLRLLPEPARRYLTHAIAPGTPLASTVRLKMHGEFRVKAWSPFTAEQVIRWDGEMLWRASTSVYGLPVTGFDSVLGGEGKMLWRLFGLFPIVSASGPDVTRSGVGRVEGESVWLPSLLCHEAVAWTAPDSSHAHAAFTLLGEKTELALTIDSSGGLKEMRFKRWGNPEGHGFHYADFGGIVEEERTFGGFTIPTRMRVGWYFGTDRFETEGEFFRVTVDGAEYR